MRTKYKTLEEYLAAQYERNTKWRNANLDKVAAYQKAYNEKNKEKLAAYKKEWRLKKIAKAKANEALIADLRAKGVIPAETEN